jgi:hypothetical protein
MSIMNGGVRGTAPTLSRMRAVAALPHFAATAQQRPGWSLSLPSLGSSDFQSDVSTSVSAAYRPMVATAYVVRRIWQAARPP